MIRSLGSGARGTTERMRELPASAIRISFVLRVTPPMSRKVASSAGPPSPEKPLTPVPANTERTPVPRSTSKTLLNVEM